VTLTVPCTVPDVGQVEDEPLLEPLLDEDPLPHDMAVVVAKRFASWVRPKPDAI
jgi:hypothetical protein